MQLAEWDRTHNMDERRVGLLEWDRTHNMDERRVGLPEWYRTHNVDERRVGLPEWYRTHNMDERRVGLPEWDRTYNTDDRGKGSGFLNSTTPTAWVTESNSPIRVRLAELGFNTQHWWQKQWLWLASWGQTYNIDGREKGYGYGWM